ncbi:chemotaxis protein CheA [Mesoterricola silvestris]|uniref:histidine kinase n=1 Tax=Mesoterricola silvestris TaxID=2927979 RepID=A0AA48GH91_9BACT|nr:chemotaxis protein CheA [Mesoterricola silvestris]BDU70914.1 chemotaxis protein CheA [Mesoterricola silvestris]
MSEFSLDDPSFYEDFLVEAGEHFELIEQNFLTLEESPGDLEILNAIFRSVHTIKGASGFLGLAKVQALAHIGENILDDLRKGRMKVSPEVMEVLFETEDTLKVLVNDVAVNLRKQGAPADPDTSGLIARLEALKGGGKPAAQAQAPAAAPAPARAQGLLIPPGLEGMDIEAVQAAEEALAQGVPVMALKVRLLPEVLGTPFNPLSMISMVDLVGRMIHSSKFMDYLDLDHFNPAELPLGLLLLLTPSETPDSVRKLFDGVKYVTIEYFDLALGAAPEPAAAEAPDAPAAGPVAEARKAQDTGKNVNDTIRVSQVKLDNFMNTVAELIISKTMIAHIVERLEGETLTPGADALVKELRRSSVYLDQVSKEIQASVLGIRMVPVKTIFTKFPRMLRDLAKASGKKIELQMVGEDTEIDKSLIEELSDPLIHLIRNSADHGIEMPDVRAGYGKSETGTVVLRARHEGDSVLVEIEDDGKGINPAVIRSKAVEKGILSAEKAESITDDEAINLIFLPGFSTAKQVTDISGRGVGMDVVKSNVRKLNGSVSVTSSVGRGSIFTIKLPLTLAIIDALLMRSGGQVFALPGTAVEETLLVPKDTLSHLTRRKAINLRGEVLGVTRLSDLLHFKQGTVELSEDEELPVVVVSTGGRRMGVIVDAFLRRQEMVIKPLAPYLASLPGISGASIMGDGGVVLILDPAELLMLAVQEGL